MTGVWQIPLGPEVESFVEEEIGRNAKKGSDYAARARSNWLKDDLCAHLRGGGFEAWTEVPCVGGVVGHNQGRMDVWAIKPTWEERYTAAYEVKVTRTDFLSDRNSGKYEKYRRFARRLYYACPAGLVKKAEVPDDVGLIVRGDHGWRHLRHPVPYEAYTPSPEFMLMLLRRSLVEKRMVRNLEERVRLESNFGLADKVRSLGWEIGRKLAQAERGIADETAEETYRREAALALLDEVEAWLPKLGIEPGSWETYGLAKQAEFVGRMLAEAERVQQVGRWLQMYGARVGDDVDRLVGGG